MEHTKGKWYWDTNYDGQPHNLRCDCGGGLDKHILFVGNDFLGQYAFENAEANAEFIVKACNNYDKLVEAVKVALWDGEHDEAQAQHQGHPRLIERLEIYRQVLKEVE